MPNPFRCASRVSGAPLCLQLFVCVSAGHSMPVLAQQEVLVEEVLVTGSYLRGSPLDGPSPVQVIDRSTMQAQGAAQVWDVIKQLGANSGSISNVGSGENSQTEGVANINLRNLGENSSLTLVNGRRQVAAATTTRSGGEMVDINAIPMVMLDRIEVLTDGGSALYGSDAVAGAVNLIMRTDFEGFEVSGDLQAVAAAGDLLDATADRRGAPCSDLARSQLGDADLRGGGTPGRAGERGAAAGGDCVRGGRAGRPVSQNHSGSERGRGITLHACAHGVGEPAMVPWPPF